MRKPGFNFRTALFCAILSAITYFSVSLLLPKKAFANPRCDLSAQLNGQPYYSAANNEVSAFFQVACTGGGSSNCSFTITEYMYRYDGNGRKTLIATNNVDYLYLCGEDGIINSSQTGVNQLPAGWYYFAESLQLYNEPGAGTEIDGFGLSFYVSGGGPT